MSKVYEALKKAQREGRWHEAAQPAVAADEQPIEPQDTKAGSPEAVSKPLEEPSDQVCHIDPIADPIKEGTRPVEVAKQLADSGTANGRSTNGIVTTETPRLLDDRLINKPGRPGRFWQRRRSRLARGPRLIVNQESLSRAGEQFQVLRANLESWAFERNQRIILITSALPGEGKSFVAANLAVALSRAGSNVLLVDANLRTPSLHLSFNLLPLSGLLAFLEGKAEFHESITETPEPRLKLIAAGGITLSGPEILAGARMKSLIEQARQLQPPHIILLDAPAAISGAEAQILSKLVDGSLLVVAANRTPRATVGKALELIKGAPVLTAVLNRFEYSYSSSRQLSYYGKYNADAEA